MSEARKTFAIYSITKDGIATASRLWRALPSSDLYVSQRQFDRAPAGAIPLPLPMGPTLATTFRTHDCHVFIVSIGAVVRMIAPLLESKKTDPAVVCVDDAATYSICVLSGHVGRGNEFTSRVASAIGAKPVITTASDVKGTLTVDILGREFGWVLDDPDHNVTRACAAVVNEENVLIVQECGEPDWWPLDQPLPPGVTYTTRLDSVDTQSYEMVFIVSDRDISATAWDNAIVFRPKSLALGLGCDKGTPFELVEKGVKSLLADANLSIKSVKGIASIDQKANEPAFTVLSEKYDWPFSVYPAPELDAVPGIENPSEIVKKYVGTKTVAEAAALLAAGAKKLLVPKRSYSMVGVRHNMTMAVARIPYPPRLKQPQFLETAID